MYIHLIQHQSIIIITTCIHHQINIHLVAMVDHIHVDDMYDLIHVDDTLRGITTISRCRRHMCGGHDLDYVIL